MWEVSLEVQFAFHISLKTWEAVKAAPSSASNSKARHFNKQTKNVKGQVDTDGCDQDPPSLLLRVH